VVTVALIVLSLSMCPVWARYLHSSTDSSTCTALSKDVARAKEYIEKQVENAGSQSSGRDQANQADDYWGAEGDQEPWMEQYMYKRK